MPRFGLLFSFALAMPLMADSGKCAACHPAETKLHNQSRMAHAMTPGLASAFAKQMTAKPLHESADGFEFVYQPVEAGLQVTAERGKKSAMGVIEWVLGAGSQGQTPLVRVGNTLFESRVSYFTSLNQYGITIGQPAGKSADAKAALGLKESHHDAETCLMCHSTGLTKDLEPIVPGVQCERCHAGAEEHAVNHTAVANPGRMTPKEQVKVCGQCHRLTPPVDDKQAENVRFQPLRLMKSQCFASGKLECTTCHPAHVDARRNDAGFYNEKCNGCHGSAASGQHLDERKTGDCVGCHMPVVQLHPALKFTDHYIRVVAGAGGDVRAGR